MMKPFTLSARSWIYRIANFGFRRIYHQTDICTLLHAVATGLFVLMIATMAVVLLVALVAASLWNTFYMIFGDASILPTTIVVYGVVLGIGIIATIEHVRGVLRDRKYAQRAKGIEPKEPGFVALTYRRFKDKTCFKIQFVQEDTK